MADSLPEPNPLISTPVPQSLPGSGWAGFLVVIVAGLTGFFAQWAAVLLWFPPAQQTTVWLLGGAMMAVALQVEPRRWVAVLPAAGAGQALLFITLGLTTTPAAILLGLESILVTAAVAGVLRRATGQPTSLGTFREFLYYIGIVVVGGSLFASAIFMAGAAWVSYRPVTFLVWRTFVLSAALGYLMVTPMLLLVRQEIGHRADRRARRTEAATLLACLVVASSFVFQNIPWGPASWPLFAIVVPPLLLWAALRFAAFGASTAVLVVTLISTFSAARGVGPFTAQSAAENALSLQLFMLGSGLPLIGLAVVLDEHRRTMDALRHTHGRLREMHRDLLSAREEESTRIARELHDDVGQRLALVSIGLSRLRRTFPDLESAHAGDIGRLQEQTSMIARTLRQLSHELHPAALEHVGLAAMLQMKCDEVSGVTGLQLQLSAEGETAGLPPDVALCMFRVAQEALANVVRHAGARHVSLVLHRSADSISLQVTDDGSGFAADRPAGQAGLGLHSAKERVRLLRGTLTVESAAGAGTRLRVNLPIQGVDHA